MNFTLQSADLSVEVNPIGMEISSIKSKTTDLEYLWQGNPAVWNGQAPVLFPIVGSLKDGFTIIDGKKYEMPKHGILRHSEKPLLKAQTANSVIFSLKWDEESLQHYPFKFEFEIKFTLKGKMLEVSHKITNHGNETMLYLLGGHPAFNCPLRAGEVYEDYLLEFSKAETDSTWIVEDTGLIGLQQKLVLDNTAILPLHPHMFANDALIFKQLDSREVTLKHKDRGTILSVNFEDFDYLGIWAKPEAPFVCIEPWLGIGDSSDSNHHFEEKDGILKLEAQKSEAKKYSITILE